MHKKIKIHFQWLSSNFNFKMIVRAITVAARLW